MPTPQPGIFAEGSAAHYALEFELNSGIASGDLRTCLKQARAVSVAGIHAVFAFSRNAWQLLSGSDQDGLRSFAGHGSSPGPVAPATQRDIFVWVHGNRHDEVFDMVRPIGAALRPCAGVALDLRGFDYHHSRDLIGFTDGTANPKGDARQEVALIAKGAGEGGAFVLSQQWAHDLTAFHALDVAEQERVVGRTKTGDVELTGDAMPPDSHVSRTDVKVDGIAQKIYRRSFPYGSVATHGLYFIAFACDIERFDVQLRRMYGVSEDGLHDRLTEFSQAVTGSYWFAPSLEDLEAVSA